MKWNCSHFGSSFHWNRVQSFSPKCWTSYAFGPCTKLAQKKRGDLIQWISWYQQTEHQIEVAKGKKVMLLFDRWNPIHAMDNMLHILMQMAFCQMLLCSITQRATWYAAQCSNENSVKLLGQSFSSMVVSYFAPFFITEKIYAYEMCVVHSDQLFQAYWKRFPFQHFASSQNRLEAHQ